MNNLLILRMRFVARLELRLVEIGELIDSLEVGLDVVEETRRSFHMLVGLGGTLGYPVVTDAARRGEAACISMEKNADVEMIRSLREAAHAIRLEWMRAATEDAAVLAAM